MHVCFGPRQRRGYQLHIDLVILRYGNLLKDPEIFNEGVWLGVVDRDALRVEIHRGLVVEPTFGRLGDSVVVYDSDTRVDAVES